jgi:hypothetical protein
MRVRLFGKTSDDKGAQLENLTQRLLVRLGYRNITLNSVGSGGSEIDIHAEYAVPGFIGANPIHLVGECKAYEAVVGLPDWLKFLGKLYTEKSGSPQGVRGLFVALSGINGNVAGAYNDLSKHDKSVELISGDDLVAHLTVEFNLAPASYVLSRLGQLTADPIAMLSLGYYEGRVFWIAEFVNSTFTVFFGEPAGQDSPVDLIELVSGQIQAATYRNLSEEQHAKEARAFARKHVLGQLLINKSLEPPQPEPGLPLLLQADIDMARAQLLEEGKIIQDDASLSLPDTTDVGLRASIIREILSGVCALYHIGAPEWEALIDDQLLDESIRIKDNLVIEGADRVGLIQLMKWSPTGLLWALSPDDMLCGHRREVPAVEEQMMRVHVKYYRTQLLAFAIGDFRGAGFSRILHERYWLRDMHITERTALARFAPSSGGNLIHVLLVDHAPEPWSIAALKKNQPDELRQSADATAPTDTSPSEQ